MFDLTKDLRELAEIFGPSGAENEIAIRLTDMARPSVDECRRDAMGNLIMRKKGTGPRVMLCAHMDTVGFLATHTDDKGLVRLSPVGPVSLAHMPGTVLRFENGVRGVVSLDGKADGPIKAEQLYADVGGLRVPDGEMAVFTAQTFQTGSRVVSPYIDNRAGCMILWRVLTMLHQPECDVYAVFSAQQEVGSRGAATAAFAIQPEYAITLDVGEKAYETRESFDLGNGPGITVMNKSAVSSPRVVSWLENAAKSRQVKVQRIVMPEQTGDAGAIQGAGTGVMTGGVVLPAKYLHSAAEMADTADIEAAIQLLSAVLQSKPSGVSPHPTTV